MRCIKSRLGKSIVPLAAVFAPLLAGADEVRAATGDVISSFAAPATGPFGMTWDGTNLWTGNDATGLIYELTTTGTVVSSFAAPCVFTKGLTFDGTNLWTTCDGTGLVYELSTTGTLISSFPTPGSTARGLTWDGTNLWHADASTDSVYQLTTTGAIVSSFPTPGPSSTDLAFDGTNLWLADASTDSIYELTTTGTVLSSFASPSTFPRGLTFDGTNFWLADDQTNLIYELVGPVMLSVSVSNAVFAFGAQALNTWLTPQTSVITNDGTGSEDFVGQISQLTDGSNNWDISTTANGADSIRAQWSTVGATGPWTDISAYASDFTIASSVASSDSVTLWFRILTPMATTSYQQYSSTLTVTAQQ